MGSSSESVWLYYTRATDDGYYEKYMSTSGTLTVDYASDDRVIGNFTLEQFFIAAGHKTSSRAYRIVIRAIRGCWTLLAHN